MRAISLTLLVLVTAAAVGNAPASPTSPEHSSPDRALATPPIPDLSSACETRNPYLVTACYTAWAYDMPNRPQTEVAMVVAFRDTPDETTNHWLATYDRVGSVWGLAYYPGEHVVYAAAFHKRRLGFAVGGPGGIYRIDLTNDEIERFIRVPDPGFNRTFSWNDSDIRGQNASGKNSLGDLDIGSDGRELYVTNLHNRRIYRFSLPDGDLLGSFAHGASGEPWAHDARPFALKFHDGRLFHGVVNSAESTQQTSQLAAHVYSSEPDGSDMREVAQVSLDYTRGSARIPGVLNSPPLEVSLDWKPWKDGSNDLLGNKGALAVYPQPILADIEFDSDGRMLLGFSDRQSVMTWQKMALPGPDPSKPGLGVGDALLGIPDSHRWNIQPVPEHFTDRLAAADEGLHGGIAWIGTSRQAVFGGLTDQGWDHVLYGVDLAYWYDMEGNRSRREQPCANRSLFPTPSLAGLSDRVSDNERNPSASMGDLELLCAPAKTPTATQTSHPTVTSSTTATSTTTPSPSATITESPKPTVTPQPDPVYLPVLLAERCTPGYRRSDVVLVIDTSSSMAGQKLADAQDAALAFVNLIDLEPGRGQVAAVRFDREAELIRALTRSRTQIGLAIRGLQARSGTHIDKGLRMAMTELRSSRRVERNTPVLILLTDGVQTGPPGEELRAAAEAHASGVIVYTIGLGADVDDSTLRTIAGADERYYFAPDSADLARIYSEIARDLMCPGVELWRGR